ncbi:DoxX family protein [Evansella sp. AB-P1]|uniref:DoxX family protein n=1 Tax=Evansella sp. AB-P1 TaxID=3037653 RepID=UPI00241D4132|nr:DoxX family protein [Evansella sp. AB-P1]MDG5788630.1 DoxX family protein [Evansella sp. AB-P1]
MERKVEIGIFLVRVVVGLIFFIHGFIKVQGGIEILAQWFESIGIPGFLAYAVTAIELIGGMAMILGVGTRIISALFAIVMIVAIVTVKFEGGFTGTEAMTGYEFDLLLLAVSIQLGISGSKFLSLEALLKRSRETTINW